MGEGENTSPPLSDKQIETRQLPNEVHKPSPLFSGEPAQAAKIDVQSPIEKTNIDEAIAAVAGVCNRAYGFREAEWRRPTQRHLFLKRMQGLMNVAVDHPVYSQRILDLLLEIQKAASFYNEREGGSLFQWLRLFDSSEEPNTPPLRLFADLSCARKRYGPRKEVRNEKTGELSYSTEEDIVTVGDTIAKQLGIESVRDPRLNELTTERIIEGVLKGEVELTPVENTNTPSNLWPERKVRMYEDFKVLKANPKPAPQPPPYNSGLKLMK